MYKAELKFALYIYRWQIRQMSSAGHLFFVRSEDTSLQGEYDVICMQVSKRTFRQHGKLTCEIVVVCPSLMNVLELLLQGPNDVWSCNCCQMQID